MSEQAKGGAPVPDELAALDPARAQDAPAGDRSSPAAPGAVTAPAESLKTAAANAAVLVVAIVSAGIAQRWPVGAFTEEEKTALVAVLVPLFVKYAITPAWLEKWQEEIAAVVVVGGTGYGVFSRIKAAAAKNAPAAPGAGGGAVLGDVPGGAVPAGGK